MATDEELAREGWSRRMSYDEPRLSEMVAMYEELGFEVLLEPFEHRPGEVCGECMVSEPERYKTVYVRPRLAD